MLTFSPGQIGALKLSCRDHAIDRMADALQADLDDPIADLPRAEFRAEVHAAAEQGESYGLAREIDLRGFAMFWLLIGPAFHLHPAVQAILDDPAVPGDDKIDHLIGRVTDEEWDEAGELEDADVL